MSAQSLLLKLKGPLQSWGEQSRFRTRETATEPTKSGVLGLLASAQGRRRADDLTDLVGLEFGVRVDQPGTLERDFQTAVDWRKGPPGNLVYRYYLSDAVFVAAVSGEAELLHDLEQALKNPEFPLYLGRRSCPVGPDLVLGIREGEVETALRNEPWHAPEWYKKSQARTVSLGLFRDAREGESGDSHRDVPVSFNPERRDYAWRYVYAAEPVVIDNPEGAGDPNPFFEAVLNA